MKKLRQTSKVKRVREYEIHEIIYAKDVITLTCVHKRDMGRTEKLFLRSVRTKMITLNKCHGILFVCWPDQVP